MNFFGYNLTMERNELNRLASIDSADFYASIDPVFGFSFDGPSGRDELEAELNPEYNWLMTPEEEAQLIAEQNAINALNEAA